MMSLLLSVLIVWIIWNSDIEIRVGKRCFAKDAGSFRFYLSHMSNKRTQLSTEFAELEDIAKQVFAIETRYPLGDSYRRDLFTIRYAIGQVQQGIREEISKIDKAKSND